MKKLNPKTATKAEIRQADIDGLIGKKVSLPKVSKKVLITEIEQLDVNKQFNLISLARTNLANIIAIRDLLLRA